MTRPHAQVQITRDFEKEEDALKVFELLKDLGSRNRYIKEEGSIWSVSGYLFGDLYSIGGLSPELWARSERRGNG